MKKNKQFDIFKKECLRLHKEWSLLNWELLFRMGEAKDCYAEITSDMGSHKATITFHSNKHTVTNDYKKTARHEMIHLLLGRLTESGEKRYIRKDELVEAEEEVVQLLLRIIK